MQYKPLYDNLVVKLAAAEEQTSSGIIIPDSSKDKPTMGEVVSVGDGKLLDNGEVRPLAVKPGDVVIFKSYAPSELPKEEELVIISESDVLAIVTK